MKRRSCSPWLGIVAGIGSVLLSASAARAVEPSTEALAGFNTYVAKVEARLAKEHRSPATFLASFHAPEDTRRLRRGDPVIEELTPAGGMAFPGALLHDWRGTAFVPGASAADFERLMEDFAAYRRHYAPEVVSARVLARQSERFKVLMRVRQQHVIAVTLDTTYDVQFGHLDARHGTSISRSTQIAEIASPGTRDEHALSAADAHGFLWRLNTYWSYAQQDGGVFIQIESVSLTRSIPAGLGWAIGPFVQGVPRDSLDFTLDATCKALRK